jgi:hypothetical protein
VTGFNPLLASINVDSLFIESPAMNKPMIDVDEVLKTLAAQAVKQGDDVRSSVRDLTLRGLQARELSLKSIRQVIHSVTAGVNQGTVRGKFDVESALTDALAGMDDAVLKAVEASQVALRQLSSEGADFEDSKLKKSLSEIERMEDEFLKTVRQTSEAASTKLQSQWAAALSQMGVNGTSSGAQVSAFMEDLSQKMQAQMRTNRVNTVRAAYMLSQNFATLASGILIGLAEGMKKLDAGAGGATATAKPTAAAASKAAKR